jgi:hypothetical protein
VPQAGYCSECGEAVWLDRDGRCPWGHEPSSISAVTDAEIDYDSGRPLMHVTPPSPRGSTSLSYASMLFGALALAADCVAVGAGLLSVGLAAPGLFESTDSTVGSVALAAVVISGVIGVIGLVAGGTALLRKESSAVAFTGVLLSMLALILPLWVMTSR